MGEFFDKIPEHIKAHIKDLVAKADLPDNEESLELISNVWLEKERIFNEETSKMNMMEIDFFDKNEKKGAIVLTYSGSILTIGPLVSNGRKVSYASIGLRKDVPEVAEKDSSILSSNIEIDDVIEFQVGPIKRSSSVYKIFVSRDELPPEKELKNITVVATEIIDDFVEVNKTLLS